MNTSAKHLRKGGPSAPRGWLSSFIRDLSSGSTQANRRRLVVAFALALAIVEITAMTIPKHTYAIPEPPIERITLAKMVRIVHRAPPTPKPIVHTKVVAETHVQPRVVNPGAPAQHQRVHRIASARPKIHTHYHSKPTVHVPTGGHGLGTSKTAKAVTGGVGPGGTGTGESGAGVGTGGAPAANEPCGFVDFAPNDKPTIDQKTGRIWEYVAIIVHFPDGSQQSVDLDYPFFYNSAADDPFMPGNGNIPATFQFPPPNQAAAEPPLVQYVMAHTSSDGYTTLRDCPK